MDFKSNILQTYQRYRSVSTSSSTTPSSSLSTMSSSLYASSQLSRPNSLVGITSAYSRGLTKENERGKKTKFWKNSVSFKSFELVFLINISTEKKQHSKLGAW